jgi:hypothetical protein
MGWKASLIIVQHPEPAVPEEVLLQQLGFPDVTLSGDTTLDACVYPRDKSLNIGAYNGCLVLADDHQLTDALDQTRTPDRLVTHERILTALYPASEILSVACHSGVNCHLYSLVKSGQKLRYKKVVYGEPLREFGERLPDEEAVYVYSKVIAGQRLFRSTWKNDDVYDMTEDQLMEAFTFGVAKRLLGVEISAGKDAELMNNTPFRKYLTVKPVLLKEPPPQPPEEYPWLPSWWMKLFGK